MTAAFDPSHSLAVGLAFALGLLVGIQRGWTLRARADGMRFAGIRTFSLMGLAGGIAGALYAHAQGPATVLLGATAGLIVIGYYRSSRIEGLADGTSGFAGLVTLASGFLAGSGEQLLATAIAVLMVLVLVMRSQLHHWLDHLTEQEIKAIARFAVIALVILPLLPNAHYGPFGAWNPRQLWIVVVMVSGFSFAGYFAAKLLGPSRGILATAAAGSMVSSTAVTASVASRMKQGDGDPAILAAAVSTASVVMFIRVLLLVGILAPFALASFARLVAAGLLVSFAAAAWFLRTAPRSELHPREAVTVRNPFDLGPALLLTGLVMALTVAARWVLENYGDRGLAMVLAISGTVDVDSAIITMGGLPEGTLAPQLAGAVLAVPVILNTLFKASIAVSLGGWKKGLNGAWPLVASAAAVALSWVVLG